MERKEEKKQMKTWKKVLIILGVIGLIIAIITTLYWPLLSSGDETPTDHLRLEVKKEDGDFVYENEAVDIFFEENKRFKFYDVLGEHEGNYQYTKGRDGASDHLELNFDDHDPDEAWNIDLMKKGKFEASREGEGQKGEYRWLTEISIETDNLRLVVGVNSTKIYNVAFDGDEEFALYDKSSKMEGEYIYALDEDTDEEFLTLNFDEDDDAYYYYYSWFIVLFDGTNFTVTRGDSVFSGTYEWV